MVPLRRNANKSSTTLFKRSENQLTKYPFTDIFKTAEQTYNYQSTKYARCKVSIALHRVMTIKQVAMSEVKTFMND